MGTLRWNKNNAIFCFHSLYKDKRFSLAATTLRHVRIRFSKALPQCCSDAFSAAFSFLLRGEGDFFCFQAEFLLPVEESGEGREDVFCLLAVKVVLLRCFDDHLLVGMTDSREKSAYLSAQRSPAGSQLSSA